ncbi:MAG: PilZ domain-containing protein, partial [Myxococcota bacterium]
IFLARLGRGPPSCSRAVRRMDFGRPVQAPELIGAALSADATYRRLVTLRLRRELVLHGIDRPKSILRTALEQLGGPLPSRAKKMRALFEDEPLLLALLPGAARPPVFTNAQGWRRGEARLQVNWIMECVVADDDETVECRVLDVSRRGAFLTCDRHTLYRFGTDDPVTLRMPDALAQRVAPLVLSGVVRWIGFSVNHQARGAGVEFPEPIPGLDAWLQA